MPKPVRLKKILYWSVAVLMIAGIAEIGLHIAGDIYVRQKFSNVQRAIESSGLKKAHTSDNTASGKTGQEKPTNILTLGESSTAGLWVDWHQSYPAQLEELLQEQYPGKNIRVFVPLHVGQNTSQVANRIEQHIATYDPKLIILMVGYNNEWSLSESHITRFVTGWNFDSLRVNTLVVLDESRLFRVMRYALLRVVAGGSEYVKQLRDHSYVLGGAHLVRYPAGGWVFSFAHGHRAQFIDLWRYDVGTIIDSAKARGIPVILMTYHINPTYLPSDEFERMAHEKQVPIVRNDLSFQPLIASGKIREYVLSKDHWHPNEKGYERIARNVFDVIVSGALLH